MKSDNQSPVLKASPTFIHLYV